MTKEKKIKILASVMIIPSLFLFILNDFGKENSFLDWYLQGGALLFGLYLFIQARKQGAAPRNTRKRRTISLEVFSISCVLGLFLTGIFLYKIEQYPFPIVAIALIGTAIMVFVMALIFRKKGYLRSFLLKEYQKIDNEP